MLLAIAKTRCCTAHIVATRFGVPGGDQLRVSGGTMLEQADCRPLAACTWDLC